ncbi:MAG: ATP-dependent sacrificial sulfur transferase LarE [Armatimonadetes bacterium]|nr:ATP-dependent sacrificial sulfur transferase LarE [Armatimonadota bacterium]
MFICVQIYSQRFDIFHAKEERLTPEEKEGRLLDLLRSMESVIVAYSGGVDSAYLAKAAYVALGERALAVTARSASYPQAEMEEATRIAQLIGIPHRFVDTDELSDPNYAANPTNRCYFCKSELFSKLEPMARELGYKRLVYGAIADDRGDFRPGQQAARELGIRAPMDEADLTKEDIRHLSRKWDLPTWNKASFACLSSRFAYGNRITEEKLHTVEAAEQFLRESGFWQFRVRHHEEIARIEIPVDEMRRLFEGGLRERIVARFKELGYKYVTLDLLGFRSGSMNEGIARPQTLLNMVK